ncbi:hypothetical protein FRC03_004863 [Tulasnella sp. 419]|nr:hypothetical protein FRC03_004863 [Tulasnella sp. 419]
MSTRQKKSTNRDVPDRSYLRCEQKKFSRPCGHGRPGSHIFYTSPLSFLTLTRRIIQKQDAMILRIPSNSVRHLVSASHSPLPRSLSFLIPDLRIAARIGGGRMVWSGLSKAKELETALK